MKPNHAKAALDGFRELTANLQALDVDKVSAERIARRVAERYTFKARRAGRKCGAGREGMFGVEAAAEHAGRYRREAA